MSKYLALLRGINVGGKSIIKMADLRVKFEEMGFSDVATYIQSGNVVFGAKGTTASLEKKIEKEFATVVVLNKKEMKAVMDGVPKDFGKEPEKYRYDVIFLKRPLTMKAAMKEISAKEGVDDVWPGKGVIYFRRLISKASSSYLSKVVQKPAYKKMTIRNWNTTRKMWEMMEG